MVSNRSQYALAGFLAFIALLAICFAIIRIAFSSVAALGSKVISYDCSDWEYRAEISGVNAVVINVSTLTWKGKPMPQAFLNEQATLKTPIGEFSVLNGKWTPHFTNPPWWSNDYKPPCSIEAKFVGHKNSIDDAVDQGFYETPLIGFSIAVDWDSSQLLGTPPNWVHVSLSEKSFWADPNMFDRLEMSVGVPR